jgi:hypothetical protein
MGEKARKRKKRTSSAFPCSTHARGPNDCCCCEGGPGIWHNGRLSVMVPAVMFHFDVYGDLDSYQGTTLMKQKCSISLKRGCLT